jgi:hypothetical protein
VGAEANDGFELGPVSRHCAECVIEESDEADNSNSLVGITGSAGVMLMMCDVHLCGIRAS